jgi:putative transposase
VTWDSSFGTNSHPLHEPGLVIDMTAGQGTGRALVGRMLQGGAGRWFVSFTVEVERAERTAARPDAVVGVPLAQGQRRP